MHHISWHQWYKTILSITQLNQFAFNYDLICILYYYLYFEAFQKPSGAALNHLDKCTIESSMPHNSDVVNGTSNCSQVCISDLPQHDFSCDIKAEKEEI